jgi:hypothetical protein
VRKQREKACVHVLLPGLVCSAARSVGRGDLMPPDAARNKCQSQSNCRSRGRETSDSEAATRALAQTLQRPADGRARPRAHLHPVGNQPRRPGYPRAASPPTRAA